MKFSKQILIILTFGFIGLFSNQVKATHFAGADFSYTCVGPNTFLLTFNLFRDCSGVSVSTSAPIFMYSDCGDTINIVLPLVNAVSGTTGQNVSQLCPPQYPNSSCTGGALPGMQKYVYEGIVVLAPPCDSWHWSWTSCCRNTSVNLAGQGGFWLSANMNSMVDSCNNSPVFGGTYPIPYICTNQALTFNPNVTEPDGDSLVYSLVSPYISFAGGVANPVTFNPPYSATQPITGMTINPATGDLNFTPTILGSFVLAIQVCEYEYGTGLLKGCITKDFQFIVQNCSGNTSPTAIGGVGPNGNPNGSIFNFQGAGSVLDSTTIEVCVGYTFSFDLEYNDADTSDTLTLTHNIAAVLPGATVVNTPGNPASLHVTWTTQSGTSPFNAFTVTIADQGCPIPAIMSATYVIQVIPSVYAGPDQSICEGVQWAQLHGTGGTIFVWSVLTGDPIDTVATSPTYNATCQNCQDPQFSPAVTTTYILASNLLTSCQTTDTVTITAAQNYVATAGPDTITCSIDSLQLWSAASIPGTFTYRWDNILSISNDTLQDPLSFNNNTLTYNVTMTSADGCIKSATTTIAKVPPIPVLTISASPGSICNLGDSSQLTLNLGPNFTNTCTGSSGGCQNTGFTGDVNFATIPSNPTTSTSFPAPFGNSVKSAKQQYIYLASELTAQGFTAGIMTEIGFNVLSIPGNATTNYFNYSVKIGCTTLMSMPGTLFPSVSHLAVQPSTITISPGWNMLAFTNPYVWDGTSNLMVEVCFDNRAQGAPTSNAICATHEITTNPFLSNLVLPIDTASACGAMVGDAASSDRFVRPDTRFRFCYNTDPLSYNYIWTNNTNISDTTIANPMVWPDVTTTYPVILADTFGVCADTTEIIITVTTFDAGSDTLICGGDSITLSPSAVDSCPSLPFAVWFSNTGLGVVSVAGITPTISVNQTTTFYGTYTNFCGCSMTDSVTVFVNEMLEPNLTFIDPTCGFADGTILVQNNGGLSPFMFSIDSGNTFLVDSVFTPLARGVYTTQYMDSNGCLSPFKTDTLINPNTPIIDGFNLIDPFCFSSSDGEILVNFHGGDAPHSISIDNGLTWLPSGSITGLPSGNYIVIVQDSNGCVSYPDTVDLVNALALNIDSITVTNLNCYNDSSGTILIMGTGGTGSFTYSIDNGQTFSSNPYFTGLKSDTFSVVIQDSLGCLTPFSQVIITEPNPLGANFSIINDSCFNACGGSASVIISGGTLPYTYNWRKGVNTLGSTTASVTGLCEGTDYELITSDSSNCQNIIPFIITQPDLLVASTVVTPVSCYGTDDGTITVSAIGGIAPYKYSINGGANFSNSPIFTGLAAGTYNIVVSDSAYRCNASTIAIVVTPDAIITTTNITQKTICISGCTPLIATATGGIGTPYNYIWNNGFDSSNAQTACPTQTTIYSVYAVDSIGCTSPAVLITLDLFDSLTIDAGANLDLCPNEPGQLNAIASGGNGGNINYQWTPVNGLSGGFVSNPTATPYSTITYTVRVTDNCETPAVYDTVQVVIHPNPIMDFYAADTTLGCEPFDVTLINSSNPVQFAEWTIGNAIVAHGFQIDITDLMEGLYDVNLRVVTPFGCENTLTKSQFLTVYPKPVAKFNMDPEKTTVYNTIVQFADKSIGDIQTWEWDFAGLDNSADANPLYRFPEDTGTFEISLKVTTVKLCADETTNFLTIGEEYNIFIPNSFTPNGDGQNDVFAPRAIGVDGSQYSLLIYNRWGSLIFESIDLNQPWDGRIQGTTTMAQNGVYVWKIVAHDNTVESQGHTYNGTVNLIR